MWLKGWLGKVCVCYRHTCPARAAVWDVLLPMFACAALLESIRVAQQLGDGACVSYALSLLSKVLEREAGHQNSDVLRRCRTRAADLGLWRLHTLAGVGAQGSLVHWLSADPVTAGAGAALARVGAGGGTGARALGTGPGSSGAGATGAPGNPSGPMGKLLPSALCVPVQELWGMQGRQHVLRARLLARAGHASLAAVERAIQRDNLAGESEPSVNAEAVCAMVSDTARRFPAPWLSRPGARPPGHCFNLAWDLLRRVLEGSTSPDPVTAQLLLLVSVKALR